MGQYHKLANLDKKQIINPHVLGCGLKLREQLAVHPGTGSALLVLLASHSNGDGGGDLKEGDPIIGSWRGDRIVMVGDYDDAVTYETPDGPMTGADIYSADWTDVSLKVAAVIERELRGKFVGSGWRNFEFEAA